MSHGSAGRKLRCVVVTPETTVLETEAEFVAIPAFDGEIGLLASRAPLVARLAPGELRLANHGQQPKRYFIDGGFAQVRDNVVTVLTARARSSNELDSAAAQKQLEAANALVPTSDEQFTEKEQKLSRARAQLRLAKSK